MLTRRTFLASMAAVKLPKPVRFGVWGLIGHTEDAVGPLKDLPDVTLAAVADPNSAAANRFAKRFPGAAVYASGEEMISREKLDVIVLSNNNGDRAAAILHCAKNKLHVFAEKPLALNLKDLNAIKDAVSSSRISIGCMLKMRTDPWFLKMRELVQQGAIGEVAQIEAQKSYKSDNWPEWKSKRSTYGGTIPWIGVDLIDLIRYTSGRDYASVNSLEAHIGFPELGEMENSTASLFRMDNGGVGVVRLDYFRPSEAPTHGDDRLRLAGTNGVLEYQMSTGLTLLERGAKPRVVTDLPARSWIFVDFLSTLYAGANTAIPAAEIYRSTYVAIQAAEAARQNRTIDLRT